MFGTKAWAECVHRCSGLDSDSLAFKGASEAGGGPADCAGEVREGMPCVDECFDAQPGGMRDDMAAEDTCSAVLPSAISRVAVGRR